MVDYNLSLRIASVFIIAVASFLGIWLPLMMDTKISVFRVLNAGSAGVMLGLAMCHLLPDADEILSEQFPSYNWSFALACAGVVLVLAIEQVVHLVNLDDPKEKEKSKKPTSASVQMTYQSVVASTTADCDEECAFTACVHQPTTMNPYQNDDHGHANSNHTQFEHGHSANYGDDHGHRSVNHSSGHHDHSGCQGHDHSHNHASGNNSRSHSHDHGHEHSHHGECGHHHTHATVAAATSTTTVVTLPTNRSSLEGAPLERLISHDHAEHDHILSSVLHSNGLQTLITAYVLEVSIAVHSVIIGVDMGLLADPSDNVTIVTLLVALCFHQFIEGIGLGSAIQASRGSLGDSKVMGFVLIFSLTMPIGIMIGIGTAQDGQSSAQNTAKAIANCFATGSLLYISLSEMVANYFGASDLKQKPQLRMAMLGAFSLGVLIMAIIANWA